LIFQWTEKERILTVIASVIVAHTAWHWMLDRYEAMQAYNYSGFLDHSGSTIINWVIVSFVTAFVYLILRRLFIQIME